MNIANPEHFSRLLLAASLVFTTSVVAADRPASTNVVNHLPVKEVTVFKDGHAFVVHEGRRPVEEGGQVVMDYLPAPVLGTFWAYSNDKNAKLVSVTASQRRTMVGRTALTLRELLEANVGAECFISENTGQRYPATILGFPARSPQELAATSPPFSDERLPQKGNLVLLKIAEGTRALPVEMIQLVTFKDPPKASIEQEEFRNALTLKLDWAGRAPASSAEVGLVYVQRGIRWIPNYRVDLDGKGQAVVRLQASVLNELADLQNVTLHLVIGVPTFYFKDNLDPIALQQTAAQLSQFFQGDGGSRGGVLGRNFLNNGFMAQSQYASDSRASAAPAVGGDPDLPQGARNEDLFVFTIPNFTLRKGDRAVVPVAEVTVPYEDVFVLDLPFAPPTELSRNFNSQQQAEMARLLAAPKVTHKICLINKSTQPFTTAPALMLREGRVISQGLMTYAAPGASADVVLTSAVDIQVKKSDTETKRSPNSLVQDGNNYLRVDLQGKIRLTNHRPQPVEIEIVRHVLGHVDSAEAAGKIEMSNVFESRDFLPVGDSSSGGAMWDWSAWPWWWHQVNGVGRLTWKMKLEPGQPADLGYLWHYYWR